MWGRVWKSYEQKETASLHIACDKNGLQSGVNVENGVACIAVCHSLVRNAFGCRAERGDVLVVTNSSNVSYSSMGMCISHFHNACVSLHRNKRDVAIVVS